MPAEQLTMVGQTAGHTRPSALESDVIMHATGAACCGAVKMFRQRLWYSSQVCTSAWSCRNFLRPFTRREGRALVTTVLAFRW